MIDATNINSGNILYYPRIEFFDETWVKSSLCVWDKIHRIVPHSYQPNDSDEIKIAIELGLIEDIQLTPKDLSIASEQFEAFWENVPEIPAGLDSRLLADVKLHPEKVDARIRPLLNSLSKIVDEDGWLRLSPAVGNSYMLFLAESISRHRNIAKLTDDSDMYAVMHYFSNDGNFDIHLGSNTKEEFAATTTLSTILPSSLEYMNIREVIGFRKKTEEARANFRNSVREFSTELSQVDDEGWATSLLDHFDNELKKNDQLWMKNSGLVIEDVGQAIISMAVPVSVAALTSIFGDISGVASGIGIGSSAVLSAVGSLANSKLSRRGDWKHTDSSYYLQMKKHFGDRSGLTLTMPNDSIILDEFVND